jgi:hypothetical protein
VQLRAPVLRVISSELLVELHDSFFLEQGPMVGKPFSPGPL